MKRQYRRSDLSTPSVFAYMVEALERRGEMTILALLDYWSGDVSAAAMHAHLQAMENRGLVRIRSAGAKRFVSLGE